MLGSDFNDLHAHGGLGVVREQLMAALGAEPLAIDAAPAESPAPSVVDERITLSMALERFALAMPDAKIWDAHQQRLLRQSAFKLLVGKDVFAEWSAHDNRKTVQQADVAPLQAAAQKEGAGGLSIALQRYIYLYPSDTVWDGKKMAVVGIRDLRHAIAADFDSWIKHPQRRQLDIENLVFDPTQKVNASTHINMFRGLPLKPARADSNCTNIRRMLNLLCNEDPPVFDYLANWLAYPLQHVGAKMDSAIMMHSSRQGSGKSFLFDGIIRKIYGEYGATLGQHQLESQYTDWRSKMLFGLFEEVLSRDQKFSHTGTIKHMITGSTHRIEKKYLSGWEEANHMNAVFLSNEIQPFPLDDADRRMFVVWPENTLPPEVQRAVQAEVEKGGIEAFYAWLLARDLGDFNPRTPPPMTEAKERLIDFGRAGWDTFYREWQRGALDVPFCTCLFVDLFAAYCAWATQAREKTPNRTRFTGFISVQAGIKKKNDFRYVSGATEKKGVVCAVGKPPDGETQKAWGGKCIYEFQKAMQGAQNAGDWPD